MKDLTSVSNLHHDKPCSGNHELITFNININKNEKTITWRRDWRRYSKEKLLSKLREVDWYSEFENVQDCWNSFECKLITVIDEIAPVSKFVNNEINIF